MSFLLKIVEGPNKGAEIALVDGVSVTLGKGDECDIVLADPTLPEEPLTIEASADGVSLGGERLEPLHVVVRGSSSFAVGPADAPWGALVWEEKETGNGEQGTEPGERGTGNGEQESENREQGTGNGEQEPREQGTETEERGTGNGEQSGGSKIRRLGCLIGAAVLVVVLLALLLIGLRSCMSGKSNEPIEPREVFEARALSAVIERYGLVATNRDGRAVLIGDFAARAERLAATAEAYSAQPGIELDFADAVSLKAAVANTLSLIGEKNLFVTDVTNRVAVLAGEAANLRRTLEAISADVPKIAGVDAAGIGISGLGTLVSMEEAGEEAADRQKAIPMPSLPVCGILTEPYPCLVLRDGRRILEGAPVGDLIVQKIEADSVSLTNSLGRIEWKP